MKASEELETSGYIDWKKLAQERLVRLVETEHDHSVALERLNALQTEYRQMLQESERRFNKQDNEELRQQNKELWELKNDLAARNEALQKTYRIGGTVFVKSLTWFTSLKRFVRKSG